MQIIKPKLKGDRLERLILLTVISFSSPIDSKTIYSVITRNFSVARSSFHLKMKELVESSQITKLDNLCPSNCSFYTIS